MKKSFKHVCCIIIAILLILAFFYYFGGNYFSENFGNKDYKWITSGTCASNKMQNLTQSDCSGYLNSSNYTVTGADHGPPGCWLVLGNSLDNVVKENPQFAGKGFACWSQNKSDGKQCSPDFPCICK